MASPKSKPFADKSCATCGRAFGWRKKWARDWVAIKHCSRQCRAIRLNETDEALERYIMARLSASQRLSSSSLLEDCERLFGKITIERIKWAARRLAHQERLTWFQKGRLTDPSRCAGAFELRLSHQRR